MDNERILERERYQIQQIMELDSEELQIEEAESESSADDDDNEANNHGYASSSTGEFMFDASFALLHTYLGEVEDTHHRMAFLDGGAIVNLPLFYLEGVVLFPEATLPLRVIHPNLIASIERALRQNDGSCTIGVVRVYRDSDNGRISFATIGTTAEIRKFRKLEDGSLNVVIRGQQRFCLKRRWIDAQGTLCGEIQIIQEDLPLRTPRDAVGYLLPLKNLRSGCILRKPLSNVSQAKECDYKGEINSDASSEESFEGELSPNERMLHHSAIFSSYDDDLIDESTSSEDDKFMGASDIHLGISRMSDSMHSMNSDNEKCENIGVGIGKNVILNGQSCKVIGLKKNSISQFREVPRAFWPYWVYRMYDSYFLAERVADRWKQVVGEPNMDGLVRKPDLLSFHIASKIPVSVSTRQELLEIDGISYRLLREIELLERFDRIRCKNCQTLLGRRSDMLVMSNEGSVGAFVNPHGSVHEIMTLYKANDLALIGTPVEEYSWFPGYAWINARCATCESNTGWLFTATNKKLKPKSFWGIRSSQVADDLY